jgi:hypothetical protein
LSSGVLHGYGLELEAAIYGFMKSACLEQLSPDEPADRVGTLRKNGPFP